MPATSRIAPTALTPMTIAGAVSVGVSLVGNDSSVDDCGALYVSGCLGADRLLTAQRCRVPVLARIAREDTTNPATLLVHSCWERDVPLCARRHPIPRPSAP